MGDQPGDREESSMTCKPYDIPKTLVWEAWLHVKANQGAAGIDGETVERFEEKLGDNLYRIWNRMSSGSYFPPPVKAVPIPKKSGGVRILGIPTVADRIAQTAVKMWLEPRLDPIFRTDSYGYRPGKSALAAIAVTRRRCWDYDWVVEFDIRGLFTEVSQEWVVRFLEHRIGDERILRLIQKWLRAGFLEDEVVTIEEKGTGQGSVISPLLANVYLHYVFDLWAARWRRREATGDMIMVRYADDIVVGFQHEDDARRFWDEMRERLRAFSLALHPEKTRLIEFGRFAARNRELRGLGKPETFKFLGFVFICAKSRRGVFQLRRKSRGDRMMTKLQEIKEALRKRMHVPIPEAGTWLAQIVAGYFAYHAVPTNSAALEAFRYHVVVLWHRQLCRRSQRAHVAWERMAKLADEFLPKPRILHPWPSVRFAVRHPR
jgi:RNA-directed DNA polymerase